MSQIITPKITSLAAASGQEMIWLRDHKCKAHGHKYCSHFNCFLREQNLKPRIGFLDIESQGSLDAIWGLVVTFSIKPQGKKPILRKIKSAEILNKKIQDRNLVQQFIEDVQNYDVLAVYYGCDKPGRHDMPFLRARAEKWGFKGFPKQGEKKIIDLYDIVKKYFKYPRGRRRMGIVCDNLGIPSKQTPMEPDVWRAAGAGNQKAINRIGQHNIEDVISTEMLWDRIIDYHTTRYS